MIKKFFANLFGSGNKKNVNEEFFQVIKKLEEILGFRVTDRSLFIRALTHSSSIEKNPHLKKSNERLEYLGDAVLDLVVAEFLFRNFPEQDEGFLTKVRSRMVFKDALDASARKIGLDELVFFNKKFIGNSEAGKKTINADAFEALVGAIYMDKGLETAKKFIYKNVIRPNLKNNKFVKDENYKGRLLELTHSKKIDHPIYKIVKMEGPDHQRTFTVKVFIGREEFGTGVGHSKKSAEQNAAKVALLKFNGERE